ncbi:ATP synthase subunit delta [Agaricicola taiwanensis]|uniref:ATP synthase subunit delta n=1 Tax=Agaricicola taiwanensis TaxID=591372 RepID=A0A8J2VKP1_9RHOB|nr:F0F1 ATP synthase subunit delta [Agaricicola taiwanensis]GGE27027.1 ATP synthase subunit delta [Agaricicola taiwanensis]
MADDDLTVSGMAGRYATALFSLAEEANAVDAIGADLTRFEAMMADSADLRRLVESPVFSSDDQLRAIGAILDKAGITGLTGNFLRLIAQNRRLFALPSVIRGYRQLVAQSRGEVTAQVTVAGPLADDKLAAVRAALAESVGKDVNMNVTVDPSILGGIIVKVGSRMVDASLRTKLNSIKLAMKEVG